MFRISIFLLSVVGAFGCILNPIVKTHEGKVLGKCVTDDDKDIYSFTSIPYAKPPVGNLRFEPPVRVESWKGILNATVTHGMCSQIAVLETPQVVGSEDCLYLNVYTPTLKPKRKLPVMVYIHGGGYTVGAGNRHYPNRFVKENVVFVTLNYRLGVLGFLATGDAVVPGNNGLKDQSFAIKWVKKNIKEFGGDSNKITVFGQSAGSSSSHYHMFSPLTKDLIKGVISQSGIATSIWALDYYNVVPTNTKNLAKFFNCSTDSTYVMVKSLKNVPLLELVSYGTYFPAKSMLAFHPVIEPKLRGGFITKHPYDILKSNKAARIPFITGMTTEDASYICPDIFRNIDSLIKFNRNFKEVAEMNLGYVNNPYKNCITNHIQKFYYDNKPITNSSESRILVEHMFTDRIFLYPLNRAIELHMKYTNSPVYTYAFGFRGSRSNVDSLGDWFKYGVSHSDDLLYMYPRFPLNEVENLVSKLLVKLWVNFATYHEPTPGCVSNATCWTPVATNNIEYFLINNYNDTRMLKGLYKERMHFWDNLPLEDNNFKSNNCV